ncbi:hypothetical protein IMG5_064990 [Ichthyophthirius multifiliis]|uniref:Uncharacterized protein n=1 Tax=Ichthyophthirius multifiliis TaxID=5932 RepID=G0QP78_ICHMU|nr:hypothetical protein IMG5_064990 [Ichthyophthirius multifiliis]EGR32976.1 hypothetical protein IMG5_064990 [Ichthyophthirius multifiliis]|eukprot:XP_004036962.1 hypothetical protein IMG5_064990 [Ichthyophthirius multifiliis]
MILLIQKKLYVAIQSTNQVKKRKIYKQQSKYNNQFSNQYCLQQIFTINTKTYHSNYLHVQLYLTYLAKQRTRNSLFKKMMVQTQYYKNLKVLIKKLQIIHQNQYKTQAKFFQFQNLLLKNKSNKSFQIYQLNIKIYQILDIMQMFYVLLFNQQSNYFLKKKSYFLKQLIKDILYII